MALPLTVQMGPLTYYGLIVIFGVSTPSMFIFKYAFLRKILPVFVLV